MSLGGVGEPQCRTLELVVNEDIDYLAVVARALRLVVNEDIDWIAVVTRALLLIVNEGASLHWTGRGLFLVEERRDLEPFPWLMKLVPEEQYRGGQVSLYGDGFGDVVEVGAAATVTTSSVDGSNIGTFATDRTAAEWVANEGATAWLRLTFVSPQPLCAIALEDRVDASNDWGTPLFRFSDAGPDVVGAGAVAKPVTGDRSTEYPVGGVRTLYVLPAVRTVSWVEVRVSSGGLGTKRGLSEVWVFAAQGVSAESAAAVLNPGASETPFGIVSWANRSPGLWPANGGQPIEAAIVVTVPADAESGMVEVRETT